jgi:DNA-binding MarR family transcriptional regulator
MTTRDASDLIQDFLGSTHVFSSTIRTVVEERLLQEVVGEQLTFQQFKLLRLVARTDGHTIGEVASFLGVSDAAASKSVDKLVRRKYVSRSESKSDRRMMHLTLLENGRRVVEGYEELRDRKMAEIFASFRAAELHQAAVLLDRLSATLVDHGADPEEICLQCGIYFRDRCLVRELANRNCFYSGQKHTPGRAARHKAGAGTPRTGTRQRAKSARDQRLNGGSDRGVAEGASPAHLWGPAD